MMDFTFKHKSSGELKKISLTEIQIQDMLEDDLFDELTCDCQSIGETNVVECSCESYFDGFALQPRG